MKVLILGGDGFIGSYLLKKHLALGHTCIIVDIETLRTNNEGNEYTYIHADLSKNSSILTQILLKIKPDFVYNCVAVATPSYYVLCPKETYDLDFKVNYENICEPLLEANMPFVHFSTSEVYGKKWTEILKEDTSNLILGPTQKQRWIYASSKILLEQLLLSRTSNVCIVRPQNFCGWDMDWLPSMNKNNKKWIPRLPACHLNSLLHNEPLRVVKPGTQKRCYTLIDDAAEGLVSISEAWYKTRGQVLNVGNPSNETTIENLTLLYSKWWTDLTGTDSPEIVFVDGEKLYGNGYEDCERRLFDDSKMFNLTGWRAATNLENTVKKIIQDAIVNYKPFFSK
jgi:UDP-apiose/xylose synthase